MAGATFQDALTSAAKTLLSLDSLSDTLSPQNAIQVVEVRNVTESGDFLIRGGTDGRVATVLNSGGSWTQKPGVIDVGRADWMVTLRGRATQQVRITDIVPELAGGRCSPPLSGSLVLAPGQGSVDVIPLEVTIDAPVPQLEVYAAGGTKAAQPYFTGPEAKNITLDRNESEAFLIEARANSGYCRWRYRIHYQVDGKVADMVLSGPGGDPFELTAELPDARRYANVYFPSFLCTTDAYDSGKWFAVTGKEYASRRHTVDGVPCAQHR